ncbi:MAG: hypothetical protein JXR19_04265 [Bacteroidia bacterium]
MKTFSLIPLLLILSTCTEKDIIGTYKSKEYSNLKIMWMYHNKTLVPSGTTLVVNQDSTYIYESCGNIITGHWKVIDDSLNLFAVTNRWRSDSLNKNGFDGRHPQVGNKPSKYGIGKNYLRQSWHQEVEGKEFKMVVKLVK